MILKVLLIAPSLIFIGYNVYKIYNQLKNRGDNNID